MCDIKCKSCGSKSIVKNGKVNGDNQRYKCKECKKNFTITERKYDEKFKIEVIKWYLEGAGIRSIERRMNVSSRVIIYWIRNFAKIIQEKLIKQQVSDDIKDIEILEVDRT